MATEHQGQEISSPLLCTFCKTLNCLKDADGKANFPEDLINPLTDKPIESWYNPGETYDSLFTTLGNFSFLH